MSTTDDYLHDILDHADGILRAHSWHLVAGERQPWVVYRVIVNGHQVGLWTKPRRAKRDLRDKLRAKGQRSDRRMFL